MNKDGTILEGDGSTFVLDTSRELRNFFPYVLPFGMILFLLFHANNPVGYVSFQLKTTLKFKLVASGKPYRHLLGNPKRGGTGMGSKEFKVGLKIHQKVIKPCANTSQKNPKQL